MRDDEADGPGFDEPVRVPSDPVSLNVAGTRSRAFRKSLRSSASVFDTSVDKSNSELTNRSIAEGDGFINESEGV